MAMTKAERLSKNVSEACEKLDRDFTVVEVVDNEQRERLVATVGLRGQLQICSNKPIAPSDAKRFAEFLHANFVRLS
jgi:hypothetical protein